MPVSCGRHARARGSAGLEGRACRGHRPRGGFDRLDHRPL